MRLSPGICRKIVIVAMMISSVATGQDISIPVVPCPQQVLPGEGHFKPGTQAIGLQISGVKGATMQIIRDQLSDAIVKRFSCPLDSSVNRPFLIRIGTFLSDPGLSGIIPISDSGTMKKLDKEGYILKIAKKEILIAAYEEAGLFYGVQSLRQLLRAYPGSPGLPAFTIIDWPDIGFRCIMDDISRGPVPSHEFMKEQIRRYAELKINAMSFYIEHIVRTDSHPDFAPANGGISIDEFRELSEYAADYQIELVGNFQSLGHFEKILSFPQYRHLGATDRMLDPLNPESMEFLREIYREMAPAFSSNLFNPNCDEAWDLSRGLDVYAKHGKSVAEVYANHVSGIDSALRKLGKKTMIWGDIVLEHPGILEMIQGDIIIAAWTYGASDPFSEYIDPVRKAGFDFTVSPGILNSNRLFPDYNMTLANARNFIKEGYRRGAIGVYCTVWDDGGMHFFSNDWYGVAYNADQSWRPNDAAVGEFDYRFSKGIYGDADILIPKAIHKLNELSTLAPTYEMNSGVFWKSMVPGRGEQISFDPKAWVEVKRIAGEVSGMLEGAATQFYSRDLAYLKFTSSQYLFLAEGREELLSASRYYAQACKLQSTDRNQALEQLKLSSMHISACHKQSEKIMMDFGKLWDQENRPYSRDVALLNYLDRTSSLADQRDLLDAAIEQFSRGGYLPSPSEIRLDITEHSGQYFQFWLLTGGFSLESYADCDKDFLLNAGCEAGVRPFPGMRYTDSKGTEREWIKFDSPKTGEVDLAPILTPNEKTVAYAYCLLNSPDNRSVTALLGSNDGATVYCNGEVVYKKHIKRNLIKDEDAITLDLESGPNHILVKIDQWKAGWGFTFRLKDETVRNHKQKYYIL